MAQISYTNKVALNENPEILDINKVTDDDMNEIKQVVNDNYNNTIQITDTEPTDSDNKLWIDTSALSQSDETNMKYNDNGEYKDIYVKAFDTLPVGTEVDYDGSVVPSGWTEVSGYNVVRNVLWTNSSPTSNFAGQTITLSSSDYDYLEVWYYTSTTNIETIMYTYDKNKNGRASFMVGEGAGSNIGFRYRFITSANGNSLTFGDGGEKSVNSTTSTTNNTSLIPYKVIGCKEV